MKRLNSQKGFTLIELLVYMAIVGIVVVIAGQVYSDNTKMRVRTQNMLAANEMAENVAALIRDDLAQMGSKTRSDAYGAIKNVMMYPDITTHVPDSSSFTYSLKKTESGKYADEITFRRTFYEKGIYKRVEQISWYVNQGTLYRSCVTIVGSADPAICPAYQDEEEPEGVEIATGVTNFMLTPAKPSNLTASSGSGDVSVDGTIFPSGSSKAFTLIPFASDGTDFYVRADATPSGSGESVTLYNFSTNYKADGSTPTTAAKSVKHVYYLAESGAGDSWTGCKQLTFEKGMEYEITFNMGLMTDMSRMFRPGVDHMAVGLRKITDGVATEFSSVNDYLFYPPEDGDGTATRSMRFSLNETGTETSYTGCFAFTFAFFSPTVNSGSFVISNLNVRKVIDADYTFVDEYQPNVYDRKNVRAFRLIMDVVKGRENGHAEMVIPVPGNGTKG